MRREAQGDRRGKSARTGGGAKRTAQQGDLCDVPDIGEGSQSDVFIVEAGSVFRVEEEHQCAGALANVQVAVAIAIGVDVAEGVLKTRRSLTVKKRRSLVGDRIRFVGHCASEVEGEGRESCR